MATPPSPGSAAPSMALDPVLDLDKGEEQALYLTMLGVELDAGVKVAKDQLHSARGVVECRRDGILESCQLRVRLMERELSSPQPLQKDVAKEVLAFLSASRPELKDERLLLTDVLCDYVGKKSPPYDVEDVDCKIRHPRLPSEAVFGAPVADEIATALSGDTAAPASSSSRHGAVSCHFIGGSQRAVCVVRALTTGILADQMAELSAGSAALVARRLLQATLDKELLSTPVGRIRKIQAPSELMATLVCTSTPSGGQHLCRAGL